MVTVVNKTGHAGKPRYSYYYYYSYYSYNYYYSYYSYNRNGGGKFHPSTSSLCWSIVDFAFRWSFGCCPLHVYPTLNRMQLKGLTTIYSYLGGLPITRIPLPTSLLS